MITLYSCATPNGYKASIMLEETGLDYELRYMDFDTLDHKQDWFLDINPNGRIPAIVDHENDGYAVFESGAILLYLADKVGVLLPTEGKLRMNAIQWLMFATSNVGPTMAQACVFFRPVEGKTDAVIHHYQNETLHLMSVLERRLGGRPYLMNDYSIVDIAHWCWVSEIDCAGLALDEFPRLRTWVDRVADRPAVRRGLLQPERTHLDDERTTLPRDAMRV